MLKVVEVGAAANKEEVGPDVESATFDADREGSSKN